MRPGNLLVVVFSPLLGLGVIAQAVFTYRQTLDRTSNVMMGVAGACLVWFGCWVWFA